MNLVPALNGRFQTVRDLGRGGEGDLLLVRDGQGSEWVVKQYAAGWSANDRVLERLEAAHGGHDPRSWVADPRLRSLLWLEEHDQDKSVGVFYEVQEYLELGPIDLRAVSLPQLVRAVTDAITIFHFVVGGPHRDVKPANILVRDPAAPVLVLADVGLARSLDASKRHTHRDGSPAYQAPEAAVGLASEAGDWWSAGMIFASAALGAHPFVLPDGHLLSDEVIRTELAQKEVPRIGDIQDDRIRLLCQGLLTRDADRRWGADEVQAWQRGETPPIAWGQGSGLSGGADQSSASHRHSVVFGGTQHYAVAAVAVAMATQPEWAGRALFEERDGVLLDDLHAMLRAEEMTYAIEVLDSYRSGAWEKTLLRLIHAMNPSMTPILGQQLMVPAAIAQLASDVVYAGSATWEQQVALSWVVDHDVWRLWRDLPGMDSARVGERLSQDMSALRAESLLASAGAGKKCQLVLDEGGRVFFREPEGPLQQQPAPPAVGFGEAAMRWLSLLWNGSEAEVEAEATPRQPRSVQLLDEQLPTSLWAQSMPLLQAWIAALAVRPEEVRQAVINALQRPPPVAQTWWWDLVNPGGDLGLIVGLLSLPIAVEGQKALHEHIELVARREREAAENARMSSVRQRIDDEESRWRVPLWQKASSLEDSTRTNVAGCLSAIVGLTMMFMAIGGDATLALFGLALILWPPGVLALNRARASHIRRRLDAPPRYRDPAYHWDTTRGDWVRN